MRANLPVCALLLAILCVYAIASDALALPHLQSSHGPPVGSRSLASLFAASTSNSRSVSSSDGADVAKKESQCDQAIKELPWADFEMVTVAREAVAQTTASIAGLTGSELLPWLDQTVQRGELPSDEGKFEKARTRWLVALEAFNNASSFTACELMESHQEFEARCRLSPAVVRLEYELQRSNNLRGRTNPMSATFARLNQSRSATAFKSGSDRNHSRLQTPSASESSSSGSRSPRTQTDINNAIAAMKGRPGKIAPAQDSLPTTEFEAREQRLTNVVSSGSKAAGMKAGHSKTLLEIQAYSKRNRVISNVRNKAIHAVKCKASCTAAVSKYAPYPQLRNRIVAEVMDPVQNPFRSQGVIPDTIESPMLFNLAQVIFDDVRAANLKYATIASNAIMSFEPVKAAVVTLLTRVLNFLRWALANLNPPNNEWVAHDAQSFWAFILNSGFCTTDTTNPSKFPNMNSNDKREQAYVGEIGGQAVNEVQFAEVVVEGNIRQSLSLLLRFANDHKLGLLLSLTQQWLSTHGNGGAASELTDVNGAIRLDVVHMQKQFERIAGGPTEEFCYSGSWVTVPQPGINGYLKYGCSIQFYQEPRNSAQKRVRWPTTDEVQPPLSDREVAFLYGTDLAAVADVGCAKCRAFDLVRRGHRRVPWRGGGDEQLEVADTPMPRDDGGIPQGFQAWSAEAGQRALGGPSGTTDGMMQYALYFSPTRTELLLFRNALAAWMELGGDHSFHEVLAAAEPVSIPYARAFHQFGWEFVFERLFFDIAEKNDGFHLELGNMEGSFRKHVMALNSSPGSDDGSSELSPPSWFMSQDNIVRRSAQWWYFSSFKDLPNPPPRLVFPIKPTPQRQVPPSLMPSLASDEAERLGYLQVTLFDTTLARSVRILVAFDETAFGAATGRISDGGHADWNAYDAHCTAARVCVELPSLSRADFAARLAEGEHIDFDRTHPAVVNRNVNGASRQCVVLQVGAGSRPVCSNSAIDVTYLRKAIVTMKRSKGRHTLCRFMNDALVWSLVRGADQVADYYAPFRYRLGVSSQRLANHNIVHWRTAQQFLCGRLDHHGPIAQFIRATSRCSQSFVPLELRTPESVLELCTEGSLRLHSMGCHFLDNIPVTCVTDAQWWRELAHRTAVCLYTYDDHYPQFRQHPDVAVAAWRQNAIDILNDMARHPFSESYFPPYTASVAFSGVKGKATEWLREQLDDGHIVDMDWRSYARNPQIAWEFANARKWGDGVNAANPMDGPTTMLVLLDMPPPASDFESPRARLIFQTFGIFDSQAEVLMPPMRVKVVGRKTFYCNPDLGGVPPKTFQFPIGPYTEVYLRFESYRDYHYNPIVAVN